ncbi:N-acetylmuramidase domain-containing protein [uncultured Roseobacter sp.]|uniref:N-acetylmuramidase domain-containing protein n=1 Tax=uncultured Roseobacter sp. TaxID=114847 RepID=UPI002631B71E|nr:N-acetylmuramidase domain-containing protein [uncultured Roseobacter sp.]
MTYPWNGAARPMSAHAFESAANDIGCEVAAIKAIWEVEASGAGFTRNGAVKSRFEPHKMPGSKLNWRDSMEIPTSQRTQMFLTAYRKTPEATLEATSWGGPQIMGFNHRKAGFSSALEMVEAMAEAADAHLAAFVTLVTNWGLDAAIRAHDWQTIEVRYNGGGQGGAYAKKMEAAYRRHSGGKTSPAVLRIGVRGPEVKRLQQALGIEADGAFGPATLAAVRQFQSGASLPVDGIVGKRTWGALVERRDAKPVKQATGVDVIAERVLDWGLKGGGGIGAGALLDRAPGMAVDALFYGGAALALVVACVFVFRWARDAA